MKTLIVMAKAPRVGHGKSRLARDLGLVEAWRINRSLQSRALRSAKDARWGAVLAVAPAQDLRIALPGVWPIGSVRVAQERGDLGARLAAAMRNVSGPVAVIGTDCPAAGRAEIAAAFQALKHAKAALGPCPDGGFWILAARRARDVIGAFAGVRWSTVHARADLEARLPFRVAHVAELADIDTGADWRAFQRSSGW